MRMRESCDLVARICLDPDFQATLKNCDPRLLLDSGFHGAVTLKLKTFDNKFIKRKHVLPIYQYKLLFEKNYLLIFEIYRVLFKHVFVQIKNIFATVPHIVIWCLIKRYVF